MEGGCCPEWISSVRGPGSTIFPETDFHFNALAANRTGGRPAGLGCGLELHVRSIENLGGIERASFASAALANWDERRRKEKNRSLHTYIPYTYAKKAANNVNNESGDKEKRSGMLGATARE